MSKLQTITKYTRRLLAMAMCLVLLGTTSIAYAQEGEEPFDSGFTEQDLEDINNQTPWYGPSIDGCTIEAGAGTFTGDNIKDAFLYFMDPGRGLTAVQSAGIVGNLIQESGVNPRSNQAGGPGMGIAQWSEGGRWEQLKKWVAENNKGDPFSLGAQLDFLWHEMADVPPWNQTLAVMRGVNIGSVISDGDVAPQLGNYLKKGGGPVTITNQKEAVTAAAFVFERKFEKAGIPNMPRRVANAEQVLTQFGSLAPSTAGSTTVEASGREDGQGLCGGGGIGQGQCAAGANCWPVADQKKHSYGNAPCKSRTCHHDGTAAFDLMYGARGNMDGKAVYAITAGSIDKVGIYHGVPGCYSIQFESDQKYAGTENPYFYWYGHLQNPKFKLNDKVQAGQQIAEVARLMIAEKPGMSKDQAEAASSRCRGGRDHLHIDRGCISGNKPQRGGGPSCRDSSFVRVLNEMWEALPQ
jgi:hypothetical protein